MRDPRDWQPSRRLRAVAEMVPSGSRVADIGSGHGLLARWLLESGRAAFCVASEPDVSALARVARLAEADPLSSRLDRRVGDGLSVLRPEDHVSVVVIAGLGGGSIRRILESGCRESVGVRRFVLQPQTYVGELRRWLASHGLSILEERLVEERRHYYTAIAAEPGCPVLTYPGLETDDLFEAGPCLVRDPNPVVRSFWRREAARLEEVVARIPEGARSLEPKRRLEQAWRVLAALPVGEPSPTSARA